MLSCEVDTKRAALLQTRGGSTSWIRGTEMAALMEWYFRQPNSTNAIVSSVAVPGNMVGRGIRISVCQKESEMFLSLRLRTGSATSSRRLLITVQARKRQIWAEEPLVRGKVTKRAMHIIRDVRIWMQNEEDCGTLYRILDEWVAKTKPERRDWLDVLKDFDNRHDREILFKLSEWSVNQGWFEANARDYTKLIERYGKIGRIEDAERTLQVMEAHGIVIDLVTLTVLIGIYGKARLLERAVEIFETAKEKGFMPDTRAYNALMIAYGYAGQPNVAEMLLEEMAAAGVVPDTETYCGLINGYGRMEQVEEAQRVFELMVSRGVKVTTKVCTALLDAYGKVGDSESARVVFDSLRCNGFTPDDRAISLMIKAYERRDLLNRAVGMVVELENAGIKPGPETFTTLIGWFGRLGLLAEAEEVFREMEKNKLIIRPKTCSLMYKAYSIAGQLDKAKEFAEVMKGKGVVFNEGHFLGFNPGAPQLEVIEEGNDTK